MACLVLGMQPYARVASTHIPSIDLEEAQKCPLLYLICMSQGTGVFPDRGSGFSQSATLHAQCSAGVHGEEIEDALLDVEGTVTEEIADGSLPGR